MTVPAATDLCGCAAEAWSDWIGIAEEAGFGLVPLLPGIWPSFHLDTASAGCVPPTRRRRWRGMWRGR